MWSGTKLSSCCHRRTVHTRTRLRDWFGLGLVEVREKNRVLAQGVRDESVEEIGKRLGGTFREGRPDFQHSLRA